MQWNTHGLRKMIRTAQLTQLRDGTKNQSADLLLRGSVSNAKVRVSIGSARAHRVEAHPWGTDQPAQVVCDKCADNYCEVCFAAQHRKGSRKTHVAKPIASIAKSKNGVAEDVRAKKNGEEVRTFCWLRYDGFDLIIACVLSTTTTSTWMTRTRNSSA